jgi:predicted nucleic acid-binding protein
MERTDRHAAITDAGPLIHLDELACLDLFSDYSPLIAPAVVWHETHRHRPQLQPNDIPGLRMVPVVGARSSRLTALADSLDLAAGETAALMLAERYKSPLFFTDDSAARLAGESLGLRVHGTIGILVRSIRRGLRTRPEVLDVLMTIRERSTLYIAPKLLAAVIARVAKG